MAQQTQPQENQLTNQSNKRKREDWFGDMTTLGSNSFRPSLDVRQLDDKTMLARMEMPGVDKGDVNIQLRDNNLIVSGEKKSDYEENKEGFYRYESSFGSFQRSFPVGGGVKENDIKANLKNGVLELKWPVAEQTNQPQQSKYINID